MQENFSKTILTAAILLIIFTIMFEMNHLMPLHRDDYDYSMIWKTGEHLDSLADVFQSSWRHYFLHGGRMFTVFCLSLFLWLGKFFFDVANALMFTALVVLIYLHARREIKFDEPITLAAAGLLAWLCLPHFGEVAVWKSGSTVYLWSAVPVALFALPYNLTLAGTKNFGDSAIFTIAMFLLGIIAGCSVENLAVTVTFFSALMIFLAIRKGFLTSWMLAGTFGNILGFIILLAAPGNFVRYDAQSVSKGIGAHIGNQFAGNGEMLIYLLPLVLLLICAFSKGNKIVREKSHTKTVVMLLILIASYFCDGLVARGIKTFCENIIFPSFDPSIKFLTRFDNFIMKSEEMIIYALILFLLFFRIKNLIPAGGKVNLSDFPYSVFLFLMALFNNFVMIAAPTFPARATFSSVVMILIGALAILRDPAIQSRVFESRAGAVVKMGAFALACFTIFSSVAISFDIRAENNKRVAIIQDAADKKIYFVKFPPIDIRNRALRHVFFSDFDNGVTKEGLCEFYRIEDIKVRQLTKRELRYFERRQAMEIDENLFNNRYYGLWTPRKNPVSDFTAKKEHTLEIPEGMQLENL